MRTAPAGMVRSNFSGRRRAHRRVRAGLWLLALSALYPGAWALVWPRSFFTDFPGLDMQWTAVLGPYNEHLVRDVGAFYVAFALLLGAAAITMGKRLTIWTLIAWIVFSLPHIAFHAAHLEGLDSTAKVLELGSLGLVLLLPLLILFYIRTARMA